MEVVVNHKTKELVKEIARRNNLDLVVLFGSQARNKAIVESDIDIGVFSKARLSLDNQAVLSKEFSELFSSNKVEISLVSSNNPLLMKNVLENGKILYESEKNLASRLKLYAWKMMAESKSFRDHAFGSLKKRIALL